MIDFVCDAECQMANGCRRRHICERCGHSFCDLELDENNLCLKCSELAEEEYNEDEGFECED